RTVSGKTRYGVHAMSRAIRAVVEGLEDRRLLSTSVLSWHDDQGNTGANLTETTLTQSNASTVTQKQFFNTSGGGAAPGSIFAQPLYMPGVNITTGTHQGVHNVAFVATNLDTVYAVDVSNGNQLWKAD